jgi:copper homeostasis protein
MPSPLIEVCVEGVDGLVAAQRAGADRVELCASLLEGGLTPSFGTVRQALRAATIPFHVIVRPRGGDFLYSEHEVASMLEDIGTLRELSVAGVVVGALTADGEIDEGIMTAFVAAAGPLSVTCHRAFDMTRDPLAALEALVRCGVDRVLTSGQRDTAVGGLPVLKSVVAAAGHRIKVMVCGALDPTSIALVRRDSGAHELHFSALQAVRGGMRFLNPAVAMGSDRDASREYLVTVTDEAAVSATIAAARGEP